MMPNNSATDDLALLQAIKTAISPGSSTVEKEAAAKTFLDRTAQYPILAQVKGAVVLLKGVVEGKVSLEAMRLVAVPMLDRVANTPAPAAPAPVRSVRPVAASGGYAMPFLG